MSFTRGSDYKTSTEKVSVLWISVRSLKMFAHGVRMQFILICLLQEQAKLAELQEKDPAAFPALPVGYFYII